MNTFSGLFFISHIFFGLGAIGTLYILIKGDLIRSLTIRVSQMDDSTLHQQYKSATIVQKCSLIVFLCAALLQISGGLFLTMGLSGVYGIGMYCLYKKKSTVYSAELTHRSLLENQKLSNNLHT